MCTAVPGRGTGAQVGAHVKDWTSGTFTLLRGKNAEVIKYCYVCSFHTYWQIEIPSQIAPDARKNPLKTEASAQYLEQKLSLTAIRSGCNVHMRASGTRDLYRTCMS